MLLFSGQSLFEFSIDAQTLQQILTLSLKTAGFCPRATAMPLRRARRGEIALAEDALFQLTQSDDSLLSHLQTVSGERAVAIAIVKHTF